MVDNKHGMTDYELGKAVAKLVGEIRDRDENTLDALVSVLSSADPDDSFRDILGMTVQSAKARRREWHPQVG